MSIKFNISHSLLVFVFAGICFGQSTWSKINPNPLPTSPPCSLVVDITFGNGLYVGVGLYGTILVSSDAQTWTKISIETTNHIRSVTYRDSVDSDHNKLFVAVGDSGVILTSIDGRTWKKINSQTTSYLYEVVYGNGSFVVLKDSLYKSGLSFDACYQIMTSDDGVTWTLIKKPANIIHPLYAAFGNGQFVVVSRNNVFRSPDGITWTDSAFIGKSISTLTFNDGKFMARYGGRSDTIISSSDGLTWSYFCDHKLSNEDIPFENVGINSFVYNNNTVVSARNVFIVHDDTLLEKSHTNLTRVTYLNGRFIGLKDNYTLISTDGIVWTGDTLTDSDKSAHEKLFEVIYGNNQFVAFGNNGTLWNSVDGIDWKMHSLKPSGVSFNTVAYGKGRFVTFEIYGSAVISDDGLLWEKINDFSSEVQFYDVAFGSGVFVLAGGFPSSANSKNYIYTSSDGIKWALTDSGTTGYLLHVVYGNNKFITTGLYGAALQSADGITWQKKTSNVSNATLMLSANNQYFARGNSNGTIYISQDGINWELQNVSDTNYSINSITYGNNQYVAVGGDQNAKGALFTSPDGNAWSRVDAGIFEALHSITFANNMFVAVGDEGQIMFSKADDPSTIHVSPQNKTNLSIIKIAMTKGCISAYLSDVEANSSMMVQIFNVSGRRMYTASIVTHNGILNVPSRELPVGMYIMSISGGIKKAVSIPFVLTK